MQAQACEAKSASTHPAADDLAHEAACHALRLDHQESTLTSSARLAMHRRRRALSRLKQRRRLKQQGAIRQRRTRQPRCTPLQRTRMRPAPKVAATPALALDHAPAAEEAEIAAAVAAVRVAPLLLWAEGLLGSAVTRSNRAARV